MDRRILGLAARVALAATVPSWGAAQGILGALKNSVVGAPPPVPQAGQTRTGATSASGAAGRSYSTGSTAGSANLDFIAMMPKTVAPWPITVKSTNMKYIKGHRRVALSGYTLGIIRSGGGSAYAGGFGAEQNGRRLSMGTALVGVDDVLPGKLADEAYKDLAKRLADAGFEVVPAEQVQASSLGKLTPHGTQAVGANKVSLYAPAYAPIRDGVLTYNGVTGMTIGNLTGDAAKELDAVLINPFMTVDYENIQSSGTHNYGANASLGADLRFHIVANSGATLTVTPPPPYRGGWPDNILMPVQQGTPEAFGIMYETDDRSDNKGVHNAIAMAGLGDIYRQSKFYAVEVDPGRYAALVRAAFQGLNTAIVAELVKARG